MDIEAYLAEKQQLINTALDKYLYEPGTYPPVIHQAMRYSVFAGGKRLRPILTMAAAEACGFDGEKVMPAACGIELIHTYSLIHDDLPAMDNDDFRRGKPTCHRVYGEAIAILAGDALLTRAFGLISQNALVEGVQDQAVVQVIGEISEAAGSMGLIGGQVVDLNSEGQHIDKDTLQYIHENKTGALFCATIRTGGILAGVDGQKLQCLTDFARSYGLAFQIIDDILDVEGDSTILGKTVGSDIRKEKATYPAIYGLDTAKKLARQNMERAMEALDSLDDRGQVLRAIAHYTLLRNY